MKANPNYIFLKNKVPEQRITLLQGGTRSGKTFSTIYYLIWLCEKYTGLEIDIVRDTFTALNSTVWKDFKQILVKHNLYSVNNHNKTDKYYNLNGNIISYYGADNPDKIHGRSRDILWINEANHIDEETIDQLFPRTRHRIIMDYNPAMPSEHWLDTYIENYPPLITTYRDNPFLTKSQILDIESKQKNKYWWTIYGTGERTTPQGIIYENWTYGDFDDSLPFIYGLDFGYVNDPTALVKVAINENTKTIYLQEQFYEKGLTTDEIANRLPKGALIIGDNAEPRLIDELKKTGYNIKPCVKGPDSVRQGILKIMEYDIIIPKESHNLKTELINYIWNDKKSNTPIDAFNHLLDASRYAVQHLTQKNKKFFVV